MERKEFYYLELFLETVLLDANINSKYEIKFDIESPLRVAVRFAEMIPMTLDSYQNCRLVLDEHKKERYEFSYNTGKSLLMSLQPCKCMRMLLKSPLLITFTTVDDSINPPLKSYLGYAKLLLNHTLVRELFSEYVESGYNLRTACPVLGKNNEVAGQVTLVVSLSCMGESIVTEIQQLRPNTFLHSKQRENVKRKRSERQIRRLKKIFDCHFKEISIPSV